MDCPDRVDAMDERRKLDVLGGQGSRLLDMSAEGSRSPSTPIESRGAGDKKGVTPGQLMAGRGRRSIASGGNTRRLCRQLEPAAVGATWVLTECECLRWRKLSPSSIS